MFEYCPLRNLSCETDSILACGIGIDGDTRSIRTDVNNVLASTPSASTQSQIGRLFSALALETLTPAMPSASLYIINPADSGRTMYMDQIMVSGLPDSLDEEIRYKSTLIIEISGNHPNDIGDQLVIRNLNLGSPNTSLMLARQVNQIVGIIPLLSVFQTVNPFVLNLDGRIIVPPGNNIAVSLNSVGALEDLGIGYRISVTWYELEAAL